MTQNNYPADLHALLPSAPVAQPYYSRPHHAPPVSLKWSTAAPQQQAPQPAPHEDPAILFASKPAPVPQWKVMLLPDENERDAETSSTSQEHPHLLDCEDGNQTVSEILSLLSHSRNSQEEDKALEPATFYQRSKVLSAPKSALVPKF